MKVNKNFKIITIIFSGSVVFVCALMVLLFNFNLPVVDSKTKSIEPVIKKTESTLKTTSLKIPSLKIDTVLEQVGLTLSGSVGVPANILKASWFDGSVKPGAIGSSVIVGHFGWKSGIPSIFNNLKKLKIGDKIYINDESGKPITFVVKKIKKYNKDLKVPEIFISSDGKAHLNLITCSGVWNRTAKNYLERLVIFTDRE